MKDLRILIERKFLQHSYHLWTEFPIRLSLFGSLVYSSIGNKINNKTTRKDGSV